MGIDPNVEVSVKIGYESVQIAGSAGNAEPVLMISFYFPKVVFVRLDPGLFVKEDEVRSGQARPGRSVHMYGHTDDFI